MTTVEQPQLRRPRLWHVLAIATVGAWMLSSLLDPSGCTSAATIAKPTRSAPAAKPDTTITSSDYRTGQSRDDLTLCEALHPGGGESLIRCGVSYGVLKKSTLDRITDAQEKQAAARQTEEEAGYRAEEAVDRCRGSRGNWSDSLRWLTMLLGIATVVTGWRRGRAYAQHKKDCMIASSFARRFPPEHLELASHEDLERVIPAAYAASAEAMSQRVSWFGGNSDEDERRAYQLQEIAQLANQERQRRPSGGWVHGAPGGDLDLPAPVLPTETASTPTASSDWRSKLASHTEEW